MKIWDFMKFLIIKKSVFGHRKVSASTLPTWSRNYYLFNAERRRDGMIGVEKCQGEEFLKIIFKKGFIVKFLNIFCSNFQTMSILSQTFQSWGPFDRDFEV